MICGCAFACLTIITPLMMAYTIIKLVMQPYKWRRCMPLLGIFIFILGYSYIPVGTPDLVRYIAIVNDMRTLTLLQSIDYMKDNLWIENAYFWLIAQIGDMQLLGAIPLTIVYSVAFYISGDMACQYSLEKRIPVLFLFQTLMLPFFSILNNIRCITAFSMVILATYLDVVKNKNKIVLLPLYVLPCFLHWSTMILIILRMTIGITKKLNLLMLGGVVLVPHLIDYIYSNISIIKIDLVKLGISKIYWYFHDDYRSEFSKRMLISRSNQVQKLVFFLFVTIVIIVIFRNKKSVLKHYNDFNAFIIMLATATLSCASVNTPQYWRFGTAVVIAGSGTLILSLDMDHYYKKRVRRQLYVLILACISIGGVSIQIWNSRYIVDYGDWLTRSLLTNIYIVYFNILRHLLV